MFVLLIIMYGGYELLGKWERNKYVIGLVVLCFITVIYLYFSKEYCMNKDENTGNMYHALLHVIVCIGHNMIIML